MNKITPTFADLAKQGNGLHVTAAHEPLRAEPGPALITAQHPGQQQTASPGPLKVAIVGTAPSSRMLAPYKDPTWKVWACSPGNMNVIPRFDAWFEIHCNLLWPEHESYGRPYIDWLKTHQTPVYMQPSWPSATGSMVPIKEIVPNAIAFPWLEMVKLFGRGFFTSSFAWMMAYAIYCGATEIALYGVDMASRDEYILQRPGFGFFRWIAETRGIKIQAPHESDIMQPPGLYGFSDSNPHMRKWQARRAEIRGRIAQMQPQAQQAQNGITYLQGADEDMDYNIQIWGGLADEVAILSTDNETLKREAERLKQENDKLSAALMEAMNPQLPVIIPPARRGRLKEARDG